MSNTSTGGPAFPHHVVCDKGYAETRELQGMTLRQYAAIHLKVPDSGTDWLDEMIKKSMSHGFIEYVTNESSTDDFDEESK